MAVIETRDELMASRVLELIVDRSTKRLITAFDSTAPAAQPSFVFGDTVPLSVRLVDPRSSAQGTDRPWREVLLDAGEVIRVGIGVPGSQPSAYAELLTPLPSAGIDVETIRQGATGVGEIQAIELNPAPYGGTFTLAIGSEQTSAIPYDATTDDIAAALGALTAVGAGKAIVSGEFPRYTISFDATLGNVSQLTADASGLVVPMGYSGELSVNTAEIAALLGTNSRVEAVFEVEVHESAANKSATWLQATCIVSKEVIPNAPTDPLLMPQFVRAPLVLTSAPTDGTAGTKQVGSFSFSGSFAVLENGEILVRVISALTEDPLSVNVTVATTMDTTDLAVAFRTALQNQASITEYFDIGGTGLTVSLTYKTAAANDATFDVELEALDGNLENFPTFSTAVSGVAPVPGILADSLGQLAIVNEADVYAAVRVSPVKWVALT